MLTRIKYKSIFVLSTNGNTPESTLNKGNNKITELLKDVVQDI